MIKDTQGRSVAARRGTVEPAMPMTVLMLMPMSAVVYCTVLFAILRTSFVTKFSLFGGDWLASERYILGAWKTPHKI